MLPTALQTADWDQDRGRMPWWWNISVTLLIFSVYIYFFSYTFADSDLGGHLRFGQDMVQAGQVIFTDRYSYLSAARTWMNETVLSEVAMWLAFKAMGPRGLVLLKLFLILLTLGMVFWYLLRHGVSVTLAGALLIIAAPAQAANLPMQPRLFTIVFFALTLIVLSASERGKPRVLWLLVPISMIWINCHGGVIAGLGIMAVWLIARLIESLFQRGQNAKAWLSSALKLTMPIVAAACATVITPYGPDLVLFILHTGIAPRPEHSEWVPVSLTSWQGAAYLIVLAITMAGLAYSRRKPSLSQIAVYACTALMPFTAVRHLPLFAIAAVVVSGEHVYDAWKRWFPFRSTVLSATFPARLRPALAGLSALVALVAAIIAFQNTASISIPSHYYPVRAIALIKSSVPRANLAIHFDWGQYAIWYLGPDVKVSIDGRRESVYTDEVYKENQRFMYGIDEWDKLIDQRLTDLVLVHRDFAVYNLMLLKPGWIKVYEDPLCALFVPEDSPLRATIEAADIPDIPYDGAGMSFPIE